MLHLVFTSQFKKDYKKAKSQNKDLTLLHNTLSLLQSENALPESMRDHALTGGYKGHRECHIAPDWLLIYKIDKENIILTALRLGSHSELFKR